MHIWLFSLLLQGGCGSNCQDTCSRLYSESECAIPRPGRTRENLMDYCMDECLAALDNPGEVGDYDPFNTRGSAESIQLETDRQAAIWMDCVAQTSCDLLETNWCPPVW